jgi:hypothetical protein
MEPRVQHEQQATGQSAGAPNSLRLYNCMLRIVTPVQQLMTEFKGGQNHGHYKNDLKSHEGKSSLELIGGSY